MTDIDAVSNPVAFEDFSNYQNLESQHPTIKRLYEMFILKQQEDFIMQEYLDATLMDNKS